MRKKELSAALILYLGFVAWIVLLSRKPYSDAIILLHSKTILLIFGKDSNWLYHVSAFDRARMIVEDILNIVLFIPIGIFTEGLLRSKGRNKSLLWCTILGFICSLLIEIAQLLTKRGFFDVDDLSMNLLGAVAGGAIYLYWMRAQNSKNSNKCTISEK